MLKKDKKLQAELMKRQQTMRELRALSQQVQLIKTQGEVAVEIDDEQPLLKYTQEDLRAHVPVANLQNVLTF